MPRKIESKPHIRSLAASVFYSDMEKKDCLYASLIRSPAATGIIKDVSAYELNENSYLFTSKDIPGNKIMETNGTKSKIFGYGNVSYTGEPVGILLCQDEHQIEKEMEKVSVNFDVASLEAAVQQVIHKKKRPLIELKDSSADFSDFVEEVSNINIIYSSANFFLGNIYIYLKMYIKFTLYAIYNYTFHLYRSPQSVCMCAFILSS